MATPTRRHLIHEVPQRCTHIVFVQYEPSYLDNGRATWLGQFEVQPKRTNLTTLSSKLKLTQEMRVEQAPKLHVTVDGTLVTPIKGNNLYLNNEDSDSSHTEGSPKKNKAPVAYGLGARPNVDSKQFCTPPSGQRQVHNPSWSSGNRQAQNLTPLSGVL